MEHYILAAIQNIEFHIGDVCSEDDPRVVFEENVYVLAHDAAVDAGADMEVAGVVAREVLSRYTYLGDTL